MIHDWMQWILDHCSDVDAVARQRICILFVIDIFVFLLSLSVGFSAIFVQGLPLLATDVWTSFAVSIAAAISFIFLLFNKYYIAAHTAIFVCFVTLWVQVFDHTRSYSPQSTMVYIILLLTLPALLLNWKWSVIYGSVCISLASVATANLMKYHHFSAKEVAGYGIDFIAASVFVVFITILMRRIYEVALDRVTSLLAEQRISNVALERSEEVKRQFYRDTIYSVTNGKLCIRDESDVGQYIHNAVKEMDVDDQHTYHKARQWLADYSSGFGLTGTDHDMFSIATGEALTNAIKHGTSARFFAGRKDGCVWAAVSDKGPGIESLILPRALLLTGFSTLPSLGIGYTLMLEATDRIILKTSETGTTVVLIKCTGPKEDWNVFQQDSI